MPSPVPKSTFLGTGDDITHRVNAPGNGASVTICVLGKAGRLLAGAGQVRIVGPTPIVSFQPATSSPPRLSLSLFLISSFTPIFSPPPARSATLPSPVVSPPTPICPSPTRHHYLSSPASVAPPPPLPSPSLVARFQGAPRPEQRWWSGEAVVRSSGGAGSGNA